MNTECEDTCDDNAACVLEDGTYKCSCNEGFEGDGEDCDGKCAVTSVHSAVIAAIYRAQDSFALAFAFALCA